MTKARLDQLLVQQKLTTTRSQAENFIRLGSVKVDGKVVVKPGYLVASEADIILTAKEQYVSRAGIKLAGAIKEFKVNFGDKTVLDVGSSTGGFTDYSLKHGAKKVIAVDVGTRQMNPVLAADPRVELHEKTDIRSLGGLSSVPDIIVIDVSFISLRQVLPAVYKLASPDSQIIALCKPQFEANEKEINRGVIKNDTMRRKILGNFEAWAKKKFLIIDKADSEISGEKGNKERFYHLKKPR